MPDELMINPCIAEKHFTTPREHLIVSKKNELCIEQYEVVIEKQREWKVVQTEIYKQQKSK